MSKTVKIVFYLLAFIIFGLIGYWMPLLGDDINWGTYFGMNYFPQGIFLHYDGRYLGDMLVILITKVRPLAFIAYGGFMTLILYLIQKIRNEIAPTKSWNLFAASLTGIMILIMPGFLFQQILGWHAGFANYVPSLIFPLFMLYLVLKNYDGDIEYKRLTIAFIFIFAIGAQFFAEHLTILNVFNDVLIFLFLRKHFSAHFKKIFYWIFAGNVIGAFFMFINGAYIKVLLGTDSYRSVKGSGNKETMFNYLTAQFTPKKLMEMIGIVVVFSIVIFIYSLVIKNTKQKIANFSLLISTFVVVMPFLVVSPFGARCMFASYLFIIASAAINLDIILSRFSNVLIPILCLVFVIAGIKFDSIAKSYGNTYQMQIKYSQYQNNLDRDTYYFPQYSDTKRIWLTSEVDNNFKIYYFTHPERKLVEINYYDWSKAMNQVQKHNYSSDKQMMKAFDKKIVSLK